MRVLSVVTLISPLGEYGGPVRVALNQARELIAQGNDVVVAGAARGFSGELPTTIDGVPVALYPARSVIPRAGFAGLAAPGLQRRLHRLTTGVDVVHVHAARDLVTLPAAAWARRHGVPYVLQTHGMIDESSHPLAKPLDAALTRPVLRGAKHVFYLTERERTDLLSVGGPSLRLRELSNGVPEAERRESTHLKKQVLYLARLAPRKRPEAFVDMAMNIAADMPDVSFRLVGPDEGTAGEVMRLIGAASTPADVAWEGPVAPEKAGPRMSEADIYVLPSVDEPYPMSVLEAMARGLPVVITESCGLASFVRNWHCGIVVDGSVAELTRAVSQLLRDSQLSESMGAAGQAATREVLGMPVIATALSNSYSD